MLSTIIYRSHLCDDVPVKSLEALAVTANKVNEAHGVTGILLFNGTHFFQVLEGPELAVKKIYERICLDDRHHNVVELMRDYAPARRFGNVGMELFDLREHDKMSVLQAVLDKGTTKFQLTYEDRALRFLRTFVEAREKENYFEIPSVDTWAFMPDHSVEATGPDEFTADKPISFAFQPIVDPLGMEILSLEALMRTPDGGSAQAYFEGRPQHEIYEHDLKSKAQAFAMAKALGIESMKLSINLLPMSLVMVPNAVAYLLTEIHAQGLVPEQIVVEVTEDEAISRLEEFEIAIKQLKAAGISLAIDDFGAGSAGLLLLARFQPDIIKVDRNILCDVHKSGAKQAIVQAIIKCCASLEISVIAEGIEKPEEWMWLESAGIYQFQGFLFARPKLNGVPAIAWPDKL